jgi:hypothetical protein
MNATTVCESDSMNRLRGWELVMDCRRVARRKDKAKVKISLEQATKAWRGIRGITVLFL